MKDETEPRYGFVARFLHWLLFFLLAAQFVVGYAIDRAQDLIGGTLDETVGGEAGLALVHVVLGVTILVLATVRLAWRRIHGLPPWAETLSALERKTAHWVERALYLTMFLIPITGLGLVFLSGEDWDIGPTEWEAPLDIVDDDVLLAAHIVTHVVFFGAFVIHVGMVLKHQFVDRDGLLRRML